MAGSQVLGTLGDDLYLSVGMQAVFSEDFYAVSADIALSLRTLTAGEGDPMTVAVAHSDYTDAEVREGLDIGSFTGPDDKIQQERARRLIRKVGVFQDTAGLGTQTSMSMIGKNGSRIVRVPLRFSIGNGFALNIGLWNRSGAALTTGSIFDFDATVYGRWQR